MIVRKQYANIGNELCSSPLVEEEESESFLKHGILKLPPDLKAKKLWRIFILGTILNLVLFLFSLGVLIVWYSDRPVSLNYALKQSSYYSPLLDMIDLNWHTATVNGSLFVEEGHSIARDMPNPTADAIWEDWELIRTFPISGEQVRMLGKDPETVAKFEDEYWHLGDDAYMAQLDVFHQLHCLNTLRKQVYSDYYNITKERNEMFYVHLNHCVDILMQSIQCSGNVGVITLNWVETQLFPFPDFSINRQCYDFQKLVDYREELAVDMDKWLNMTKPENALEIPASPEYYRIFNVTDKHWDQTEDHEHV